MSEDIVYSARCFLSPTLKECLSKSYFALQDDWDKLPFPFIKDLFERHRKCPYITLLHQICPSILDFKGKRKSLKWNRRKITTEHELVNDSVPLSQVYLYVRRVFLRVVPTTTLGNKRNLNLFLNHVKTVLKIQKMGKMSLHFVLQKIKTKPILWLKKVNQIESRKVLGSLLDFLLTKLVFPLVQSFFYVTESTTHKARLFFFRKKTWHRLTQIATSKFIAFCKLKRVSQSWVDEKMKRQVCLGVSRLRFVIKRNSVRPVVNMSSKCNGISINKHLNTLLLVLTHISETNSHNFGSSASGIDDIHKKWKSYVAYLKRHKVHKLYFVKCDIEKCFQTINPCLLFKIVNRLLKNKSTYTLYQYKRIIKTRRDYKTIHYSSMTDPKLETLKGENIELMKQFSVSQKVLLNKLKALLFGHVIKVGNLHYIQTMGIPQGSVVSNILCAAYFGYMDRVIFSDCLKKTNLLVRLVDDTLFISPNKRLAKFFIARMSEGVPEFNCNANLRKSCVNFDYHHPVYGTAAKPNPPEHIINYCGLKIFTQTMNIGLDFSSYVGLRSSDVIRLNLVQNPGQCLKEMLEWSLFPKCHQILFDHEINNPVTIRTNISSLFAVCAIKFHGFVENLPQRVNKNSFFFFKVISQLPAELMKFLKRKITFSDLPIKEKEIQSVCYEMFLYKLRLHPTQYKTLIPLLSVNNVSAKPHMMSIDLDAAAIFKEIGLNILG